MEIGRTTWAFADGRIPEDSEGTSGETLCLLNAGSEDAEVELTVVYADREPVGPYLFQVNGERVLRVALQDLEKPEAIPRNTPYAGVIHSNVPIVVQHARRDTRQAANAILSTLAYSE